jgi:hypothetical protein
MTYTLPLEKRRRVAQRRNERYRTEPGYRLSRINETRRRAGVPEIAALSELDVSRLRIPVDG